MGDGVAVCCEKSCAVGLDSCFTGRAVWECACKELTMQRATILFKNCSILLFSVKICKRCVWGCVHPKTPALVWTEGGVRSFLLPQKHLVCRCFAVSDPSTRYPPGILVFWRGACVNCVFLDVFTDGFAMCTGFFNFGVRLSPQSTSVCIDCKESIYIDLLHAFYAHALYTKHVTNKMLRTAAFSEALKKAPTKWQCGQETPEPTCAGCCPTTPEQGRKRLGHFQVCLPSDGAASSLARLRLDSN